MNDYKPNDQRKKEIDTARRQRDEDKRIIAEFEEKKAAVSNRIGALLCKFNLAPNPTEDFYPPLLVLKNKHYDLLLYYSEVLHGDNLIESVNSIPIILNYLNEIEKEVLIYDRK
jgi:hypothetical protein